MEMLPVRSAYISVRPIVERVKLTYFSSLEQARSLATLPVMY